MFSHTPVVNASHTVSNVVVDTGAKGTFVEMNADCIINIQPAEPPIHVVCPNGDIMRSTHTTELSFTKLPQTARKWHVFPSLASGSLISVGVLCDAGCITTFGKKNREYHINCRNCP